jgi:hypothetical protein
MSGLPSPFTFQMAPYGSGGFEASVAVQLVKRPCPGEAIGRQDRRGNHQGRRHDRRCAPAGLSFGEETARIYLWQVVEEQA